MGKSGDNNPIRLHLGDIFKSLIVPILTYSLFAGVFFTGLALVGPTRILGARYVLEMGIAITILLWLSFFIVIFLSTVYEVSPSSNGVKFRYLLSRSFVVKWMDLIPPSYRYRRFNPAPIVFKSLPTAPGVKNTGMGVSDQPGPNMPLRVSREQALAILLHPSCPKWQIPIDIWKSLGMYNPPPDMVSSSAPTSPL